jgi:uncharacterized protein (TIGR03000 family)
MYSLVLMTALATGGSAPGGVCFGGIAYHGWGIFHGSDSGYGICFGSCYGACYGYGPGYSSIEGANRRYGFGYGPGPGYGAGPGDGPGPARGDGAGPGDGPGPAWGDGAGPGHPFGAYSNCWGGCSGWYPGVGWQYGYNAPSTPIGPMTPAAPAPQPKPEAKPDSEPDGMNGALAPGGARLIVEVPADALVFLDDRPMRTPGAVRSFDTPALEAGRTYYYAVRVQVMRDGKPIVDEKRVLIRAGEVARASFEGMEGRVARAGAR